MSNAARRRPPPRQGQMPRPQLAAVPDSPARPEPAAEAMTPSQQGADAEAVDQVLILPVGLPAQPDAEFQVRLWRSTAGNVTLASESGPVYLPIGAEGMVLHDSETEACLQMGYGEFLDEPDDGARL